MEVICLKCKIKFNKQLSEINKTQNNFCSRSCSISYFNKINPKKKKKLYHCIMCNNNCEHGRKYCDLCFKLHSKNYIDWSKIKLGDLISIRKYQKYSRIRDLARNVYRKSNLPKECYICKYDMHYEVCHIKPISSFSNSDYISDINDISNLIALCPNHHWEFDNNKISIPGRS